MSNLGTLKRKPHKKIRKSRCSSIPFIFITVILILAALFASVYNTSFKPVLKSLASYRAERISNEAVNEAVAEILGSSEISYSDTVKIFRDAEGKVSSVSLDFSGINPLKSVFTEKVNETVAKNKKITIYVPLGNLTGSELFSGTGPLIPVDMIPASNTTVDFKSSFSAEGINQTRHTISLKVTSRISLLLPGSTGTESVSVYEIPVAESIIVGLVPDTLTQVVTEEGDLREDIMNLQ